MGIITQEAVSRRLQDVTHASQESIETISLWIMHYKDKASIDIIVEGWLNCFRSASTDSHRIALFYVMNDVVQRAKNKHVDTLIPAFQPAVLSAVAIGRSSQKVKNAMARCIEIFGERQVFTKASVNAMLTSLKDETGEGEDACYDLEIDDLVRKIEIFDKGREVVANGMEVINNADFAFKSHIKERMRDRIEAARLETETYETLEQLVGFRHAMETQKKRMLELVEMLELAKRVFGYQLREVTVVEDAYQKFCAGIRDVHKELKEMQLSGVYPAATPPRDAPSPTPNDDIYATGVENALQTFRLPGTQDNLESADMEIGDDDEDGTTAASASSGPDISNSHFLRNQQPSSSSLPPVWSVPPPPSAGQPVGMQLPPPPYIPGVPPPTFSSALPPNFYVANAPSVRTNINDSHLQNSSASMAPSTMTQDVDHRQDAHSQPLEEHGSDLATEQGLNGQGYMDSYHHPGIGGSSAADEWRRTRGRGNHWERPGRVMGDNGQSNWRGASGGPPFFRRFNDSPRGGPPVRGVSGAPGGFRYNGRGGNRNGYQGDRRY